MEQMAQNVVASDNWGIKNATKTPQILIASFRTWSELTTSCDPSLAQKFSGVKLDKFSSVGRVAAAIPPRPIKTMPSPESKLQPKANQ
jgi:hypothetical protein